MPDQNYSEPDLINDTDHELLFKAAYAAWLQQQGGGGSLPDQTGHAGEFLTTDGTDASWVPLSGGGDVVASGTLTNNAIALGAGGTSVKTTTTGTGVVTALGVNTGSNGSFVVQGGALGTPSSGTLTNATGLPVSTGISGLGVNVAAFLATPSSANLAAAVTGETGSGALVFATSPTLVTPLLGTPASGTLTNCTGLPINTGLTISGQAQGDILFFNGTNWTNLPAGSNGQFLQTQGVGANPQWAATGSGSPAGANTQVQYNNSGAFGADAGLTYASGVLSLGQNGIQAGQMVIFASGGASGSLQLHSNAGGDVTWFANATGNISLSNPDTSGTIVLEDNTATLTNKVISGSSNTLSNIAIASLTGLGSGVATALAVNVGSSGAFLVNGGALGTPASGTLTNCTGLPASSLTAATLAANITLGEGSGNLILDATLSADGTYSGIVQSGTAGATLAFGDLCYFSVTDSRWELADASAASTSGSVILGICVLAAAADGDPTTMLMWGKVRADSAFPTFTVGAPVYVSETAGDVTGTQPTTTDAVIRVLGFSQTADSIWFMPSPDYLTHV